MILLDTQVVVWMVEGSKALGQTAEALVEKDPDRCISAMVGWELAMLIDKKRLTLKSSLETWITQAITLNRLAEISITGGIARDAGGLQGAIHGDPCDRIMIATARSLGCPLVTSDRAILRYAEAGHLKAIDARR